MATVKILPYIDTALLEQQKLAVEKAKQERLAQSFQDALNSASMALARMNALEEAAKNAARAENETSVSDTASGELSAETASSGISATGYYSSEAALTPLNQELASECSAEILPYFKLAAIESGVDVNLLLSIAKAESSFDPSVTSHSGAMGIMQLMPFTAEEYGVSNAYSAAESIPAGAKLLANLLTKYNGDVSLAAAAYNAGSGSVEKYNGIPPYEETQNYVKKVLSYYNS